MVQEVSNSENVEAVAAALYLVVDGLVCQGEAELVVHLEGGEVQLKVHGCPEDR